MKNNSVIKTTIYNGCGRNTSPSKRKLSFASFLLALAIGILFSGQSSATSYTWSGATNSDWGTNTNWTPNGIPSSGDNVTIGAGTHSPDLDATRTIINLTLNSSADLDLNGSILIVSGAYTMNSGAAIDINGAQLIIGGNAVFNGGTVNNSLLAGSVSATGGTTTFGNAGGGPSINANITVSSSTFTARSTTFNGTTTITKTGTSNDNSTGANTFNGVTSITNAGTGQLLLANVTRDIFNNDVTLSNSNTNNLQVGYNDATGTQLNGNVIVNSTAGTGIGFGGVTTGKVILASGKTITTGTFSVGTLTLRNFTQTGSTDQTITTTGNSVLTIGPSSFFNANLTTTSGGLNLNGCTFGGTTNLTKKGTTADIGAGGNTFTGVSTITNNSTNSMILGNTNADIFNSDVTFNNTGTNALHVAYNSAGNQFNGNTVFNNTGTGTAITITVCENAALSSATFAGTVTTNNTGTATNGTIRFHVKGTCTFNDDIIVNSTMGTTAYGVWFGSATSTGTGTLAAGNTISVGTSFTKGSLYFSKFTQSGTTAQTLTVTGTAGITFFAGSNFGGDVTTTSPTLLLSGTTFSGATSFTKNGSTSDTGAGGNTFGGTCTLTNAGSGYIVTANSAADIFNGNLTVNNNGTSHVYLAHNVAGNQFNGTTILNNTSTGAASAIYICEGAAAAAATFTGTVTVNNFGSGASAMVRFAQKGTCNFNDNIIISSTAGSTTTGIQFSSASGVGAVNLANGKTITVGTSYTKGALFLSRFTQSGTTAQSLALTGTALLAVGPASTLPGDFTASAPSVQLNGCTYGGIVVITKTGTVADNCTGNNTFNSDATITNNGTGAFTMSNVGPDIFNDDATFNNTGTGYFHVAYNGVGNKFYGTTTFNNTGSGADLRITVCETAAASTAIFYGPVIANSTGTATVGFIRFNTKGTCTFNDNVTINSTMGTTASSGVYFGSSTGTGSIASGKTISIGGSGFSKGTLNFFRFTQNGTSAHTFNLTGTATLTFGTACTFNADLTASGPSLYLNGTTFGGITALSKTGTTSDNGNGGNTFNSAATITNSGTGYLMTGNTLPDIFNSDATINNTGTSSIYLAHTVAGTQFKGNTILNNTGSGASVGIYIADNAALASAVFTGTVTANNTGTATAGIIRFNQKGICTFNDDIIVNSTMGTGVASGVSFGSSSSTGTASLAAGQTITVGGSGFTKGGLYFARFTQTGSTAQSFPLTGTSAIAFGPATSFGGDVTSTSGNLFLNGCTFSGTTNLTKNGVGADAGTGGNTFTGASVITNNSAATLTLASTTADVFSSDLTANNTGTSYLYLANAGAGNQFNGTTILNNTGTGADLRLLIGEAASSTVAFNGPVTINSTGAATDGLMRFGNLGNVSFNDNVTVNCSIGNATNYGVGFGYPGSASHVSLASGKTISVGTFTKGTLSFTGMTQAGTTAQSFTLTGTGILLFGLNSSFAADITSSSPDVCFNGSTFNGSVTSVKTSNTTLHSSGGNTFNKPFSFTNSGTGTYNFSNATKDIYNDDVTYLNSNTGIIQPAYNDATGTQFNGNIILNNSSTGSIRFGQGTGVSTLASGKTLSIGGTGYPSGDLYIKKFTQAGSTAQTINLTSGTAALYLQTQVTFNGAVSFTLPQVYLGGTTFNSSAYIEKNGLTTNQSAGANTFNSDVTIKNSGTGAMYMSNTSGDNFIGNATFLQTGAGVLYPVYNATSNFGGDISTAGTTAALSFGSGTGIINLNGTLPQNLNGSSSYAPILKKLTVNNGDNGLQLNVPTTISGALTLTNGNIYSSATNLLTIGNGITTITGVSNLSYVSGPVKKTGNQAFTFPTGSNGYYRPIAMSAPGVATDQFTAEYLKSDPTVSQPDRHDLTLDHVSRCESWTLNRTTGASSVSVTLSWNSSTSCGVTSLPALRVVRWDIPLTLWRDLGNTSATGTTTAGTVTTSATTASFGSFTLGSTSTANPLPVELTSFTAAAEKENVHISWQTISESNSDFYNVERSKDGVNYEKIATVKAAGYSNSLLNYSTYDMQPLKGKSYYRLEEFDGNGKSQVYGPVTINLNTESKEFEVVSVSPNPFKDNFSIDFNNDEEKEISFEFLNTNGVQAYADHFTLRNGNSVHTFNELENLKPGIYILKLYNSDSLLKVVKVVKI